MARWYEVVFTEEDLADRREMALQREFEELFIAAGGPKDAGLFTSEDDLPPYRYFFSPGAVKIAGIVIARYAGTECDPPVRSDVALLVGNSDWRNFFFAGEQ